MSRNVFDSIEVASLRGDLAFIAAAADQLLHFARDQDRRMIEIIRSCADKGRERMHKLSIADPETLTYRSEPTISAALDDAPEQTDSGEPPNASDPI